MNTRFLPLSVRLDTLGGVATPLVPRGTPLPVKRSEVFSTADDNQSRVDITLWMGESPLTRNNIEIGKFSLDGLQPAKAGEPKIKIEFDIDQHLTINVKARLEGSTIAAEQRFNPPEAFSEEFIEKHLKRMTALQAADEAELREIENTNRANTLIRRAEARLASGNDPVISQRLAELGLALTSKDGTKIRERSDALEQLLNPLLHPEFGDLFSSIFAPSNYAKRVSKPAARTNQPVSKASARASEVTVARTGLPLGKVFGGGSYTLDPQLCFVLMPFSDRLRPLYDDHVKPVVEQAGMRCVRADDVHGTNLITHDIWEHICRSRFLIAELTDQNPNVFYELGLAHALSRDVILLSERLESVPFDLKAMRCLIYEFTPRGVKNLESKLTSTIQAIVQAG